MDWLGLFMMGIGGDDDGGGGGVVKVSVWFHGGQLMCLFFLLQGIATLELECYILVFLFYFLFFVHCVSYLIVHTGNYISYNSGVPFPQQIK
jgi:hypothetical protein